MSKHTTISERLRLSRFIKGEKVGDQPVELKQRNIFILPTKAGLGFVLLISIILLIAFFYNNNLAYMLGFLLASIFFICILHTYRSLSGLIISMGTSQSVFAGESVGFTLHIKNPSHLPRLNLQLNLPQKTQIQTDIAAYSSIKTTLFSPTEKRGWHELSTVTVSCHFPFGIFHAWSPINFGSKTLIYPKPLNKGLAFPEQSEISQRHKSAATGSSDFAGFLEYQKGDPIRHIHWKAYAKGQGLLIKNYSGTQDSEIWLDYHYASGSDKEHRLKCLCRWVVDAEQAGFPYGFILPGLKLSPNSGWVHQKKCLEALALF